METRENIIQAVLQSLQGKITQIYYYINQNNVKNAYRKYAI